MENESNVYQRLAEQPEILYRIIKKLPTIAIVLDENQHVLVWNKQAEKEFGWMEEEVLQRPVPIVSGESEKQYARLLDKVKKTREVIEDQEMICQRKDGSFVYVSVSLAEANDKQGSVIYVCSMTNITKRKQDEIESQRQLKLAKKIQQSVLAQPVCNKQIAIDSLYIPSQELSGDMYTFYQMDEHRYGLIVIDVMGHGLSSALVSMSLRSLLRGLIVRARDPIVVFDELKKHMKNLFSESDGDLPHHFSAIYLVIDTKHRTIEYINAGHPPAMLLEDEAQAAVYLEEGGFVVGSAVDVPFTKGKISYSKRARIIMYTDGLLDSLSPSVTANLEKLERLMKKYHHCENEFFIQQLKHEIQTAATISDDICLVAVTLLNE
ncbi:sigma-B regulation protein RsbU (phosphoserine phosphatase) [Anoxybacillus vitaminiphilus]|uniref:Sigma-B regulation protein RsbU (Phosphoserine phosphatase) n=1 Tax=Paranoxybacillus vitaminiphilus TaxID=581036 RepID=A0A327YF56_9BACL|nr:SpoIIE family protein phosphatase [Anoxybacillus vitaminiphilus]RAK19141.1 sigma-B regulation protein RsbU (phosphoserine phosphatase) [Anoxybacillus vitaminiphilus]